MSAFTGVLLTWNRGLDFVRFRFVKTYSYPATATPTSYPIEDGPNITDHVDCPPPEFTFETIVSNTPMRKQDIGGDGFAPLALKVPGLKIVKYTKSIEPPKNIKLRSPFDVVANIGTVIDLVSDNTIQQPWQGFEDEEIQISQTALQFPTRIDYVQDVYTLLKRLRASATLLQVITPLDQFTNAVITNLAPKKGDKGAALSLSITVKPLLIVNTVKVARPDPTQGKTLGTVAKGVDPKKPKDSALGKLLGDKAPRAVVPVPGET